MYDELLSEIQSGNKALEHLLNRGRRHEEKRRIQQSAAIFKSIRQHARSFHAAVIKESSWKCRHGTCSTPHIASLRLEPRPWSLCEPRLERRKSSDVKFGLLLSAEVRRNEASSLHKGRRLEAQPVQNSEHQVLPSGPARTKYVRQLPLFFTGTSSACIELCSYSTSSSPSRGSRSVRFAVRTPSSAAASCRSSFNLNKDSGSVGLCGELQLDRNPGYDLGFLEDDTVGKYQHHLAFLERGEPRTCFPSLGYLLKSPEPIGPEHHLSKKDRLYIALTLASSVLQLDETPWLPKSWKSTSIFLLHVRQPGSQITSVGRLHPYLSSRISREVAEANTPANPGAALYDTHSEILRSLGFMLIELCLWKPLEDWEIPEDSENGADDTQRRFRTAKRLLPEVDAEAGIVYGDIVHRCLYCRFDSRDINIENADFQKEVFNRIVIPLSENLKNHCFGTLCVAVYDSRVGAVIRRCIKPSHVIHLALHKQVFLYIEPSSLHITIDLVSIKYFNRL